MRMIVLVHPGSMCGSFLSQYDFSSSYRSGAREERDRACREVYEFDGVGVVIYGGALDEEIAGTKAVLEATQKCERDTDSLLALPDDKLLRGAAQVIWKAHGGSDATQIVVTGAWAEPETGCAWTVFDELKRLSGGKVSVILSEHALSMDKVDEDREEFERGE